MNVSPRQSVLLVLENPVDAQAIREMLADWIATDFQVEWLRSCAEAETRLTFKREHPADEVLAIMVSLQLADCQGIETVDRLVLAAPGTPILVFCDSQDEPVARLAVQHGAQDYLLKSRLDAYTLPKILTTMVERAANAEVLFEEKERARVTLDSIGDAVISTDVWCRVTYLNDAAEKLTGWSHDDAVGQPVEVVFNVIDANTRQTAPNPLPLAIRENRTVALAPNSVLIARHGAEVAVEDSAAPIHDRRGQVTGSVMVFHDVTAKRAQSLRMAYEARHDSLTDLPNRALFKDRLNQAITMVDRHQQTLAVLFVDLDRFKQVNDLLGHDIGDRLLQAVAERLLACVRGSDTVSRQGGDEFVILLAEVTQSEDAVAIADKILLSLSKPYFIDQHELHITSSIGISTYPADGHDADTLMKNADISMYRAKDRGGHGYQFFEPGMNTSLVERQTLEAGMRHGIKQSQFGLQYQPIMNLDTGGIIGAEALIRWHHPERGLVPPAQFIPVAEDSGFIVAITSWVLRAACEQARAWQDAGLPKIQIAVNVSAVDLRTNNFVGRLAAILQETGLAPEYLALELTETFLMQDWSSTAQVLQAIKDLGVQLVLDGFGTGYSSLSYLQKFPMSSVKIDQSFVRDLMSDAGDANIVSAVIGMGRSLGLRVVAGGVETSEQLAFLRRQGCIEAQGFYFSRSIDAADMALSLRDN